jgi:hypothetical protein
MTLSRHELRDGQRESPPSSPILPLDLQGIATCLLCFLGLVLFFFLSQNRMTVVYDEGIALTAVMRVMAGQIVHRDFYYNYGPAPLYIEAGLFRLFGPSVLVERLYGITGAVVIVFSIYWMVRQMCSRRVSQMAALLCIVWEFGDGGARDFLPVFVLWPTWLVSAAFGKNISARRAFAAGVLVGIATLFRYDMGIGSVVCHIVAVAIGAGLRTQSLSQWLRAMVTNLWAYVIGLALIVAPLTWAYLRVGSLHDVLFDIVIYTAKHYRLGRGLPFPRPQSLSQLQELVVYAVLVLIVVSVYVCGRWVLEQRRHYGERETLPHWVGVLMAFSLVALMLFAKASVRIGAGGVFPALLCCIIMAAVLYNQRAKYGVVLRTTVVLALFAMFVTGVWASMHQVSGERKSGGSMLLWLLEPGRMPPRAPYRSWCSEKTPITRGLCFLMDEDHIQTVEFLIQHTRPEDTLYVGLPQHDRILINDNMTYFATQRLPATKWSHFDPFLQNSVATQQSMIADLERNKPPYVVLDSQFDALHEPNGSSVHTGVHLLDNYIAQNYRWVKTFGKMSVLQRNGPQPGA